MLLLAFALTLLGRSPPPVRVGYCETAPFCYTTKDGQPGGFAVDVNREAARREGLQLERRFDILILARRTPEREGILFASPTWWAENTILVTRVDHQFNPLARNFLALTDSSLAMAMSPTQLDGSTFSTRPLWQLNRCVWREQTPPYLRKFT